MFEMDDLIADLDLSGAAVNQIDDLRGHLRREAKRVCRSCDVRAECLEYALENDERFGIWGGMSERERRRLKRQAVLSHRPPEQTGRLNGCAA